MSFINLKTFICQVTNQLKVPLSAALLIEIFSSLQIIQLLFSSMAKFSPSSDFIITSFNKNLSFLTGAFQLQEASIYNSIFHFIWIMCLIYFLLHFVLLMVAIRDITKGNQGSRRIIKVLSWLYLLHSRLIFFPIQFFLLNLCNLYNTSKYSSNSEFYQQRGWLGGSVILLVVNSAFAICRESIMHQMNHTENSYAAKTNMYHQSILVYKLLALLLYFWGQSGDFTVTKGSTVFHLIMGLFLLLVLYVKLPFFKFRVLKVTLMLTTVIICLSIVSLIYVFVADEDSETSGGLHILILLLPPLGIKLVLTQFQYLFQRILRGEFMVVDHAIHYGLLLEDFIAREKTNIPEDKIFLPSRESYYGILVIESQIPLEKFTDRKLIYECELPVYLHIIDKLSYLMNKTSSSNALALYIAQICLVKGDGIPKMLEIMKRLESDSFASLSMRNSTRYVNDLLEKVYSEDGLGSDTRLSLSHYFKYYDLANSIKALMLAETNKQIEFWHQIQQKNLDVKGVYDKAEEIDNLFVRIRRECELNLNNFRKNFTSPMLLYAVYLNNVRQIHSEGIQMLRNFQSIMFAQNVNGEDFESASENVAVVIVSLDKAKAGLILNASGSIHNIFNMRKTELIGKKVGCLFPNSIAKRYQHNIQHYSKVPEYKLDLKENTYGKTKNDEIFELEVHFQLYPYTNKELTLMVMLKKLDEPAPILIANNEGVIVDYSKTVEAIFNKQSLNVKVLKSLQNINSGFENVNLAFNTVYSQSPQVQSVQSLLKDTVADYEDSYRHTTRSLLHGLALSPTRMKSPQRKSLIPGIPFEKAEFLCEEYLEGKQVIVNPESGILSQKNYRLKAHVSIKPFRADDEVFKIVRINNLKKDLVSSHEITEDDSHNVIEDEGDDILAFGDEFPVNNEKVILKRVSPLIPPKTNGTVRSSFVGEKKKSFLIESESQVENQEEEDGGQHKLANAQQMRDQDDQRSSVMNSHYAETRSVRTLRDIGSRKKLQRNLCSLKASLYVILAIVLILAFVKYELSKGSIEEIEKGISIINLATLRLQNAINTFLWALVSVIGVDYSVGKTVLAMTVERFIDSGIQLENELGLMKDQVFMNRAFKKDVKYWQQPVQGFPNMILIDTFTATNILITKYLAVRQAKTLPELYKITDLILIFNNTANDYIVSSNELISATDTILGETISRDVEWLNVVLSIEITALVAYTCVFIIMIWMVSKSYQRLCRSLVRSKEVSIRQRISQLNKVKALLEDDIERKAFIQDGFNLFLEERSSKKENDAKTQKTTQQSNLQMSSMNKYLIRIAIMCLLFIPLFAGLFVYTLIKSIQRFHFLESVNEELSVLSDGSLQSNLMMSTLVYGSINAKYPSMLFLNKAPALQIAENFENFNNFNQRLIDTFLTSNGREIDPYLAEILQTDVCKHLTELSKTVCEGATGDQGMGLLSLNTDYYILLSNILSSVGLSSSLASVIVTYANSGDKMIGEMRILMDIYPLMMSHILERFEETAQTAKNDEETYIILIFMALFVYTVFLHLKPLQDFQRVDLGRRKILKLLPFSLIQENKALKFYLMQDFKAEVDEIKNSL